jgi:beta-galactosidase
MNHESASTRGIARASRLLLLLALASAAPAAMGRFTIDQQRGAFLIDGRPFQIVSGEMHYLRIPPEYWRDRLLMARAMGLNTIATYVFWNMHEPRPGVFDFRGGADLARFIRTAQEVGLYVIVRPGPYACAEWEFGGYPAWLLKQHDLQVRSMDKRYLEASARYLKRLGQEIAPLQNTRGGPIIMVQFENEYGSYGKDKVYLRRVRAMLQEAGFDVPLFTSDGAVQMPNGYLPEALPAINGSTGQEIFDTIRKFRPNGPFFVAEFYPGWLDHWGEPHAHVDAAKSAAELEWMLSHGVSVNLYMFHGGTSFGFMNGANYSDHYQPQPTSYDYDAPLDEAGRPTPKYYRFRDGIAKHLPAGARLPDVPPARPTIAVPRFDLEQAASLLDALPSPVKSERPLSMEDIGQSYGYILYRTRIDAPAAGPLVITELRDYAVVLVNGRRIASLDRRLKQHSVNLAISQAPATLDILVENGGRINYGPRLTRNRKGITEKVTLAGRELTGWEIFPLPMEDISAVRFARQGSSSAPLLRKGTFHIDAPGDTFLDMRGWGKGCVLVNGHNLGRFWRIGPQQTLYLPGAWLRKGANEIVVLDLENAAQTSVAGLRDPILNQLPPE